MISFLLSGRRIIIKFLLLGRRIDEIRAPQIQRPQSRVVVSLKNQRNVRRAQPRRKARERRPPVSAFVGNESALN
jgi:hypothetical protein